LNPYPVRAELVEALPLFVGPGREGQSFDKLRTNGSHLPSTLHLYAIAIGSNRPHGRFGRPVAVIAAAIQELEREFELFDVSPILINPAHGGAGRDFANAVALVEAAAEPAELLSRLKAIERAFGRRRGRRWAARVLDLDIVLWSGGSYRSRKLTIPHPGIATRNFVLQPLAAVAPGWRIRGALNSTHLTQRLARRRPRE
jgi:2-amino-4-hydroxy-6-hydroxymethyldihydropteridine diphosphokinase